MVPLILHYVSAELYGGWLASGNLLALLSMLDLGISGVLQQRVAQSEGQGRHQKTSEFLNTGLILAALSFAVIITIGLSLSPEAAKLSGLTRDDDLAAIKLTIQIAIVATAFLILGHFFGSACYGLQSSRLNSFLPVIASIVGLASLFYCLTSDFGVYSLAISYLARAAVYATSRGILLLTLLKKSGHNYKTPSLSSFKHLGKSALESFFSQSIYGMILNIETILIANLHSPLQSTEFSVTQRAQKASIMPLQRASTSFKPSLSHAIGDGQIETVEKVIRKLFNYLSWSSFLVASCIYTLNPTFTRLWVGTDIYAGNTINFIISLSVITTISLHTLNELLFSTGCIRSANRHVLMHSITVLAFALAGNHLFGIIGIIAAPLASSSLIYIPLMYKSLSSHITRNHNRLLDIKSIASGPTAGALSIIIHNSTPLSNIENWPTLFISTILLVTSYALSLILVSKCARTEAIKLARLLKMIIHNRTNKKHP
ncbi:hypothetical protein [Pelagicoccus sp. SDUM812003]|uniref:lipopolysaccharide biosynthesis protein n=1 Tax=Pelagicoccus sp. SDUM812003 TaxID=3041267 RepID=UPI00280FADD9|nr:hypothetical protein [Pelagicoccus sp. SDUM812003]MDQ8205602.1 hypothetical protein [Pelagicoccus sp. SDUM812003]